MDAQARITRTSDTLERIKALVPFRQGYILGKLEEMVNTEQRKQEAEKAREQN